jgi:uncharacterized protein DUF4328
VPESVLPLERRARWAVLALVAVIVSDVIAIGSDWLEIDLMNRLIDGENVPASDIDSNDDRQTIVAVVIGAALVVAIVFFIRWFHAAYKNLVPLGQPNLRFKPGWAIGGWFVPVLNLWRPKQIANDIWRGSEPDAPTFHGDGWKSAAIPVRLTAWWAMWIAATYIGNLAARAWFGNETPNDLRAADVLDIAALVLDIGAAVLAILVVRRLTDRQSAHARRVSPAGMAPATIPAA